MGTDKTFDRNKKHYMIKIIDKIVKSEIARFFKDNEIHKVIIISTDNNIKLIKPYIEHFCSDISTFSY